MQELEWTMPPWEGTQPHTWLPTCFPQWWMCSLGREGAGAQDAASASYRRGTAWPSPAFGVSLEHLLP